MNVLKFSCTTPTMYMAAETILKETKLLLKGDLMCFVETRTLTGGMYDIPGFTILDRIDQLARIYTLTILNQV